MHQDSSEGRRGSFFRVLYRFPAFLFFVRKFLCRLQLSLLRLYKEPSEAAFISSIYHEVNCLLQPFEMYVLWSLMRMQSHLEGDIAEVGVFQGGSAKVLCQAKDGKKFFGFDTFSGLPEIGKEDGYDNATFFEKGKFSSQIENVRRYLSEFSGVTLVEGFFPASLSIVPEVEHAKFCLVHLDADLYDSTKAGLEFFWDRLVPRGIIVLHDSNAKGVKKAFEEFFERHHPLFYHLYSTQCVIIKG